MLNNIIKFSLENKFFVLLGAIVLMFAGVYTAGTAQRFININGHMPGKKIIILVQSDDQYLPSDADEIWSFSESIDPAKFKDKTAIYFDLNNIAYSGKLSIEAEFTLSLLQTYFGLRFINLNFLNGKSTP